MKQLLQNYKTGELELAEVPVPAVKSRGILVKNITSLVSAGTEKLMIDLAQKSYFLRNYRRWRQIFVRIYLGKLPEVGFNRGPIL